MTATGSPSGDTATTNLYIVPYFPALGYTVKRGHYYVDGILCENEWDTRADRQPDLPLYQGSSGAIPMAPGGYIVYLDVWERHLTYLDDPEIREEALLGPDTATRTKIVWQVKLLPVRVVPEVTHKPVAGPPPNQTFNATTMDTGSLPTPASMSSDFNPQDTVSINPIQKESVSCLTEFPAWDALISPSSGTLTARAKPTQPTGDPCEVPAEAGYTSLENQLYRVEIHNGGVLGLRVAVSGYGFSPGETVTLSLSGNTGLSPWPATVAADGFFTSIFFFPPSTPAGTYVLTATGTSGDTQTANFDLASVPAVELSPSSAAPGVMVNVSGYGFSPGETVTLSLSGSSGVAPGPRPPAPTARSPPPSSRLRHSEPTS